MVALLSVALCQLGKVGVLDNVEALSALFQTPTERARLHSAILHMLSRGCFHSYYRKF